MTTRTRVTPATLDEETTDHVIDMVAKALLVRTDQSEAVITWAELETAAATTCEIEKHCGGVTLRRVTGADRQPR